MRRHRGSREHRRKRKQRLRIGGGLDSEAIEQLLSRYEDAAAPILRTINDNLTLPEGDKLRALLYYVALIVANNPARRGGTNQTLERVLYFMAQMMLHGPATFEAAQAECRRDGVPLLGDVSYDELQEMVEGGGVFYEIPTIRHLQGLGVLVDSVASLLMDRDWSLLITPASAPDFISCDRPVNLVWDVVNYPDLMISGQPLPPPGFGMPKTQLVVPLGRRVTLLGTFESLPRRLRADLPLVAEINRRIVRHATRFVYSARAEFVYLNKEQRVCSSGELLA